MGRYDSLYMGHAAGGAVGWGTELQAEMSRDRFPMVSLENFHWHNPSGRTMALGSTQLLKEMSKGKDKAVPLQAWSGLEGG
jgi:hypothetical protein